MDTKSKNKWLLLVWLLLFAHGLNGVMMGLVYGGNYAHRDYFATAKFQGELYDFIDLLAMLELDYRPKEEVKAAIVVTMDEINEHRYRYGELGEQIANIHAQYEGKIQQALAEQKQDVADAYISERDKKIADITMNFQSDEHVRVKIVKEKEELIDEFYRELEPKRAQLAQYKNLFLYYLKDTESGNVYTNAGTTDEASLEQVFNPQQMAFLRQYPSPGYSYLSTTAFADALQKKMAEHFPGSAAEEEKNASVYTGWIAVPKEAITTSGLLSDYSEYRLRQLTFFLYTGSGLAALLLSLYLLKKLPVLSTLAPARWQPLFERIPLDARAGLVVLTAIILLDKLTSLYPYAPYEPQQSLYHWLMTIVYDLGTTAVLAALVLMQAKYLAASVNEGTPLAVQWRNSILFRAIHVIQQAFLDRRTGTQLIFLLAVVFAMGLGAVVVLIEPALILLYVPGVVVVALPLVWWIVKRTGYFNQIVQHTRELAHGALGPDLPVKGKSALASLAESINQLKYGVKRSQNEQAKSERLKTELITNVSHDLRTPLTSIITYAELLKRPNLSEDERSSYIEIIDRKAKRLKVLIDDLFEASKMASGNVELVKERVDLVQLLQQALAEYAERINASTLLFRVTTPDAPVYAYVDGQKIWRVFDNLIGNILKYALDNTRVYITLKTEPQRVVITFKNVTKYELGENFEELLERFKRGDTSRHTEGSGLGLAIAKSIMDLHDGSLELEVDGDLFKVTVIVNTQ